jgi:ABC-type ATPase involved in cell division
MKIEMKSQPRSSGKTTYIKLLALEEIHKGNYQKICIIGHNGHSENIFKTWIMGIRCRLGNILIGYELLEDRILLGD